MEESRAHEAVHAKAKEAALKAIAYVFDHERESHRVVEAAVGWMFLDFAEQEAKRLRAALEAIACANVDTASVAGLTGAARDALDGR